MRRRSTSVVRYPARILSTPAEDVFFDADVLTEKARRFKAACFLHKGVGLAAPQLGIPYRYFYLDYDGESFLAVNPQILEVSEETVVADEGCLSIPGRSYSIERHASLTWTYTALSGERVEEKAEGWKARIIQHECDHLDGICIADK